MPSFGLPLVFALLLAKNSGVCAQGYFTTPDVFPARTSTCYAVMIETNPFMKPSQQDLVAGKMLLRRQTNLSLSSTSPKKSPWSPVLLDTAALGTFLPLSESTSLVSASKMAQRATALVI